jgi:hypothetical protein
MKINGTSIEFFQSIPDDLLIQVIYNDWGALERLCIALTLDIQLLKEEIDHHLKKKDLAY